MGLRSRLLLARVTHATRMAARHRRQRLERELADYRSESDLRDLGAILDRYPDGSTGELRQILGWQAMSRQSGQWPAMKQRHTG